MNFRYKCYYDHEHCLEDISQSHYSSTFFLIFRQIRFHETCD
ncbi:hypothetical protein T08_16210 [Trichinella sp. T8]|nr:hypothetical protein T08_16210 [Trichinella sp. T8]